MDYRGLNLPPSSNRAQLEKVVLARKVGVFLVEDQPDEERQLVEQVALTLAQDISLEVRQTLAFELRRAPNLPHDIAEKIARDVEEVSSSFLSHTTAFDENVLADLARELNESAKIAIARRPNVPSVVAVAIAETGEERSVTYLVQNPGTEMQVACEPVLKRFSTNRTLMDHLSKRGDLPIEIIHRLVEHVSDACRQALVTSYGLHEKTATHLSENAANANLLAWIKDASRGSLNEYVRQLDSRGALTDRFLADITRRGGIRLFETAMAFRTGIDVDNVERIIQSGSQNHMQKLLKKAGIKGDRANRLIAALADARELELEAGDA